MSAEGKLLRLIEALQDIAPDQKEHWLQVDKDTLMGFLLCIKELNESEGITTRITAGVNGVGAEWIDVSSFMMNGITIYVTLMK